jgi:D-alanine-D-alanine ligase
VSLSGAEGIEAALKRLGHGVTRFDPARDFDGLTRAALAHDFAFINLHGAPGEDGLLQAMLDRAGCPYQGAGPAGSFLALNKAATKQLCAGAGIVTPPWEFLPRPPEDWDAWTTSLTLPLFAKANLGGSSLDMERVARPENLRPAMERLFAKGLEVLLEQGVPGLEVTCAVLGDEPLPPILIRPAGTAEFFDYDSKYVPGGAEELCPAPLPEPILQSAMDNALAAHRALGLRGCSRADFILREGTLHLLEVNTLPGMTPTSLLPQAAAAAGLSYQDLVARLMELGVRDCAAAREARP